MIEFNNIEIGEGLGLFNIVIIDQYFIWCMWMNCLIIVVFDYFDQMGIGIDEFIVILVENGNVVIVYGGYQVIVLCYFEG